MRTGTAQMPRRRRWSCAQYHRMAKLGFFRGQRVELIQGQVMRMAPQKDRHMAAISLCGDAVARAFGPGYRVHTQGPLHLGTRSEPEPDVSVVSRSPRVTSARGIRAPRFSWSR